MDAFACRLLVVDGVLYLIGGWGDAGWSNKVFALKEDGSDWEERADLQLQSQLAEHGVFAYNTNL